MAVDAGQPFRLNLWHCLSVICCDPDMDFFRILHDGVPLGIGSPIPPCKVLFPPESPDASVIPLQHCDSAWKSAHDHADLVDDLLATELQEGWIRPIPGGDAELSRRYRHTAVGKLGVVVSSDRLVWSWTAPSVGSPLTPTCLIKLPTRHWLTFASAFRSARPTSLWLPWC